MPWAIVCLHNGGGKLWSSLLLFFISPHVTHILVLNMLCSPFFNEVGSVCNGWLEWEVANMINSSMKMDRFAIMVLVWIDLFWSLIWWEEMQSWWGGFYRYGGALDVRMKLGFGVKILIFEVRWWCVDNLEIAVTTNMDYDKNPRKTWLPHI